MFQMVGMVTLYDLEKIQSSYIAHSRKEKLQPVLSDYYRDLSGWQSLEGFWFQAQTNSNVGW